MDYCPVSAERLQSGTFPAGTGRGNACRDSLSAEAAECKRVSRCVKFVSKLREVAIREVEDAAGRAEKTKSSGDFSRELS